MLFDHFKIECAKGAQLEKKENGKKIYHEPR